MDQYAIQDLLNALRIMGERLGGAWDWIRPGDIILLKPNLLRAASPQDAVTTHPALLEAVARIVKDLGGHPVVAESPAGPYTPQHLRRVYSRCGIQGLAENGLLHIDLTPETVWTPHEEGVQVRAVELIRPVHEVDGIINIPKAKTHTFMGLTGAVKNLFGFIPGLKKVGFHGNLMEPEKFAGMLLDLVSLVRPNLTIMDGILGMDGDGPSAGRARPLGFLLMGHSPVHVDWAFSRLVGVAPERVPVLEAAQSRGWITPRFFGPGSMGNAPSLRITDFRLPKTLDPLGGLGALPFSDLIGRLLAKACSLRPSIPSELCDRCGTCARSCPTGAIRTTDERIWIDDTQCIRCYCCHETCPKRIVQLKGSFIYRILSPLSGRKKKH